jgi:enoyl-CoA hydratase
MTTTAIPLKTEKMIGYKEDGVGWMVFNNPERRNAIGLEMSIAIPEILESFAKDPEVRVVVMTGAGDKAFVSGADISEFESRRATPEQIEEFNKISARASESYGQLGKPLIAMIRGFCLGGGLVTAMKADLRIASEDSQFGVPAARLGVGYAYPQVKQMVEIMGPAYTREILLTGARFDAQTAMRWGFLNRVVPGDRLEDEVKDLAGAIADNAPLTIKAVRASIGEAVKDKEDRDMALVEKLVADCFASEDYKEGRTAFMEKRRPVFTGR